MGKLKNAENTTLLLNNCSLYSNSRRLKKEVGEGGGGLEKSSERPKPSISE